MRFNRPSSLYGEGLQFFAEMCIVLSVIILAKIIPPPRDLASGGKFSVQSPDVLLPFPAYSWKIQATPCHA
jgi:hypothetical protein